MPPFRAVPSIIPIFPTKGRIVWAFLIKVELRGFLSPCRCFKLLHAVESEHPRKDDVRETAHRLIVILHRRVILLTRLVDAVLRAFQLYLQTVEVLVGFQLEIALCHDHEFA